MSFKEDLLMLKKINKGTIVIVQNGIFYIAIGNDAILLNKVLGLKCTKNKLYNFNNTKKYKSKVQNINKKVRE